MKAKRINRLLSFLLVIAMCIPMITIPTFAAELTETESATQYLYENTFETYEEGHVWTSADSYFSTNPNHRLASSARKHTVVKNPDGSDDLVWQMPLISADDAGNGRNKYLNCPVLSYQTTSKIVLSMDIYIPDGASGLYLIEGIDATYDTNKSGKPSMFCIYIDSPTATPYIQTRANSSDLQKNHTLQRNQWYTLEYALNLVTGEWKFYIDGKFWTSELRYSFFTNVTIETFGINTWGGTLEGSIYMDDIRICEDLGYFFPAYENTFKGYTVGASMTDTSANGFDADLTSFGYTVATDPKNASNKVLSVPITDTAADNYKAATKEYSTPSDYKQAMQYVTFEEDIYIPADAVGYAKIQGIERYYSTGNGWRDFFYIDFTTAGSTATLVFPNGEYEVKGANLKLNRDTWYTLAVSVNQVTGDYTVLVDGEVVLTKNIGSAYLNLCQFFLARIKKAADCGVTLSGEIYVDNVRICKSFFKEGEMTADRTYKWSNDFEKYTLDATITDTSSATGFASGMESSYGCTTVLDPTDASNKVMCAPTEKGDNYNGATYDFRNYSSLSSMTRMVYKQDLYFPSATTGKTRVQGWKGGTSAEGGGFFNFYEIDFSSAGEDVSILPAGTASYAGTLNLKRDTWYTVTFSVDQTNGAYYLLINGSVAAMGTLSVTAPKYAQFFFLRCYSGALGDVYVDNMHIYEGFDKGVMLDSAIYRNNFESYSQGFEWSSADIYFDTNPNQPITDGTLKHKVVSDPTDTNNLAWQIPLTSANLDNNKVYLASSSAVDYQTTPLVTLSMKLYIPAGTKGDVKMQGHSDADGFCDLYHVLMKGTSASVWVDDSVAYTGDLNLALDKWHKIDYAVNIVTGEFKLMIDGNIAYSGNLGVTNVSFDGWIIAKLQSTDRVNDYNGTMLVDDIVIDTVLANGEMAKTSYLYENTMEQYWSGHVLEGDAWFNSAINDGKRGHMIVTDPANVSNKAWKVPMGAENANNNNSALKIGNNVLHYNNTPHIVFESDLYVPTGATGTFLMEAWSRDRSDQFQYFYKVDITSAAAEITPYGSYSHAGENLVLARDTWYKIAFALDMVTGGYTIYVNGAVAAIGVIGQTNLLVSGDSFIIAKVETSRTGTGYVLLDDLCIYEGEEPKSTVIGEAVTEDFAALGGAYVPALGKTDRLAHSVYSYAIHSNVVFEAEYFVGNGSVGVIESKFNSYRYLVANIWGIGDEMSLYSIDLSEGKIYQKGNVNIFATLNVGEWNTVSTVLDLATGTYSVYVNGIGAFNANVGKTNLTLGTTPEQSWQYATVASEDIAGDVKVDNAGAHLLKSDEMIIIDVDAEKTLQYIDLSVGGVNVRTGVASLLLPANTAYTATPVYFNTEIYNNLITTEQKNSVRLNGVGGLRFATLINDMDLFDGLFAMRGSEIADVYFSTLITPTDYLEAANNVFTKYSLETLSRENGGRSTYLDIKGTYGNYISEAKMDNDPSTVHFVGSIVNIKKANYERSFSGIGYVEITLLTGETVILYSSTSHFGDIKTVANKIKNAGDGYYESLDDERKAVIDLFADYVAPTVESVEDSIPVFTTSGSQTGVYNTEKDGTYTVYSGVSAAEIDAYKQALIANGFVLYASNAVDGNEFATYTGKTLSVKLFYYPNQTDHFRILVSDLASLPKNEDPAYTAIEGLAPTLTQLKRNGVKQGSTGQAQIVQFVDGSFAIVDGGPRDAQDAYDLLQFLYANKPDSHEKPRITWFFTHLHSDHVELAFDFMEAYHELIELDMVAYNAPDFDGGFTATNEANTNAIAYQKRLDLLLAMYYPVAKEFIMQTGDVLYLPGCRVDVLHTYLDLYPNTTFAGINETSTVFKMTFDSGKSFLITGDSYPANCNWLVSSYPDALSADVVQTPHHGRDGATAGFYDVLLDSMKILLWSNSASFLEARSGSANDAYDWTHNSAILASNAIEQYHNSVSITIDMTDLSVTVEGS